MARKGKERERERDYRSAFRPGAGDPALWSREEDEETDWSPLPTADNPYGPSGASHLYDEHLWAYEPSVAPEVWPPLQQASGVETSQPFGGASGL
ncbi:hypothetical protein ColLi_05369 [Colletotrichum liriopes]|uniref:Uncharacterized protein n=1 Tax=Colletotrichum liriopes TaxID=708192 RepID=A0AA37GK66_9PEZI|nr:hypothetical protein ColLi_05369 [Colletotrichum liriopes]